MAKKLPYRSFRTLARALEVAARDSWTSSGKPIVVEFDTVTGIYEVWSQYVRDECPRRSTVVLITTVTANADLQMDDYRRTLGAVKA